MKNNFIRMSHASSPERYCIDYFREDEKTSRLLMLQIEQDGSTCALLDSPNDNESHGIQNGLKILFNGSLEEFCKENNAIENGVLEAENALINYFKVNM